MRIYETNFLNKWYPICLGLLLLIGNLITVILFLQDFSFVKLAHIIFDVMVIISIITGQYREILVKILASLAILGGVSGFIAVLLKVLANEFVFEDIYSLIEALIALILGLIVFVYYNSSVEKNIESLE